MKKILIFVSNGFEALELSPFIDIFGWNNILSNFQVIPYICSISDEINATWSLSIKSDINLKRFSPNLDEFSALIIPGGFGKAGFFNDIQSAEFKSLLNYFFSTNKIVIGICTGALALAINGFLKGIPATTYLFDNERYFSQLKKYGAIPIRKEFVNYNNIITTSAPNTAISAAFYLLELLTSKKNRELVERNMGF